MPVGPTKTKAQKAKVVHTEMKKFKEGSLHSGSKSGPVVKNRKQAIAISMSESGQSKPKKAAKAQTAPPAIGPPPPAGKGESKPNYDRSSHFKGNPGFAEGRHTPNQSYFSEQREHWGSAAGSMPKASGRASMPTKVGHLRMSGHPGAHRIGARKR